MTATFTPPTHAERFALPRQDRLWSRVPYQRGHTVIYNPAAGTVTPYPGAAVIDADVLVAAETAGYVIWRNSVATAVTVAELAALIAAGYGTHITIAAPAAQTEPELAAEGSAI